MIRSYHVIEMLLSDVGTENFTAFGDYNTLEEAREDMQNRGGIEGEVIISTIIECESMEIAPKHFRTMSEKPVETHVYNGKTHVTEFSR